MNKCCIFPVTWLIFDCLLNNPSLSQLQLCSFKAWQILLLKSVAVLSMTVYVPGATLREAPNNMFLDHLYVHFFQEYCYPMTCHNFASSEMPTILIKKELRSSVEMLAGL